MGLFDNLAKAYGQAVNKVENISKEKARSMSDDELLRYLARIDDVRSPIAQDAILDEARRRGMR